MSATESPLFRAQEAADYLTCTDRYLRTLVAQRRIAVVRIGRNVRFRKSDLDAFIEAGVIEPLTPDTGHRLADMRNRAGRALALVPPANGRAAGASHADRS